MNKKDFNKLIRPDMSDVLVHWTRDNGKTKAYEVLKSILTSEVLKGSSSSIKGGHKCVCFTDSPLADLTQAFTLSVLDQRPTLSNTYQPFGLAFKKDWLYNKGGRPVFYCSEEEYDILPVELQWRYMKYSPPSIDFTWEREWRVNVEKLELDPNSCIVILPNASYAREIIEEFGSKWLPISLSVFGFKP